ncbi:hypothetical protein GQF56_13860 [Rhodobacter sphaeroides]|jgi:hypothetical protein|nr:hypothetical protein [Cereibacter sphaeroides]QHA12435.1 hypothetical protein GQY06_01225 [Cereibacter sphaeroides]
MTFRLRDAGQPEERHREEPQAGCCGFACLPLPSCWWLVPSVIIGSSLIAWGVWALLTALGSLL